MSEPESTADDSAGPPVDTNEILAELVAECLSQRADGVQEIPFDEICAEHPELKDEVFRSVEKADRIPGLHARGAGSDRMIRTLLAGRYRVQERIGAGAMGVVYAATDLDLGREIAVKVMHGRLMDRDTAMARFDREASALAAVMHSAVVTIHDRGMTDDGSPFLVMELVEGTPCSRILEQAREHGSDDNAAWLSEAFGISVATESSFLRQAVRWTADIASGLSAAHEAGVYHRDVKPSNIMVRPDGSAVLLDFGIAATDDQASITRTDAAVGTPAYMAPELLKGAQKALPSQDVYGLSATLYHFLTLQPPYPGGASEVLTAVATREPVPAVKVRPGLPRDAQAILDHGLARSPGSRYPSAAAMESDLRALLAFRPVSVRPTSTAVRVARRVSRSKLFIGATVATLVIFGFLGVKQWREHQANARWSAYQVAWAGIPANFPLPIGKIHRGIADPLLRDQTSAAFDSLIATGCETTQARTLRALFRLDHGDRDGAAEDMAAIQRLTGSRFAEELVKRYSVTEAGNATPLRVDMKGLPEPESQSDLYIATLHAFRRDGGKNYALDKRLDGVRHVEVFRLLVELERATNFDSPEQKPERLHRAEKVYRRARSIKESSGFGGATLLHIMSSARGLQLRSGESLELANQVLANAPASPSTLQTAAESARRIERYSVARDYIERGLTIVPAYVKMEKTLALIEAEDRRYDRAREIAESASFEAKNAAFGRADLRARVEAIFIFQEHLNDPEAATQSAELLLEICERMPKEWLALKAFQDLATGFLEEDNSRFSRAIMRLLFTRSDSAELIRTLAVRMPADLQAEDVVLLRGWLEVLQATLSETMALPQAPEAAAVSTGEAIRPDGK